LTPHQKRTALWVALALVYVGTFARLAGVGEAWLSGSEFDPMARRPRAVEHAIGEGRFAEALPLAIELNRIHPAQPLVSYWLAVIYRGLARAQDEAGAWEAYMRQSTTPEEACPDVAAAHGRAGDAARAMAALKKCTELDPREPERWLDLGDGLERSGDHEGALAAYRRGFEIDSRHSILAARLGLTGEGPSPGAASLGEGER
jgi:tetratricopeptide (TPR) repeat protein